MYNEPNLHDEKNDNDNESFNNAGFPTLFLFMPHCVLHICDFTCALLKSSFSYILCVSEKCPSGKSSHEEDAENKQGERRAYCVLIILKYSWSTHT